ncbi:MAG: hypothetical protein WC877_01680 [Dehalococcoidales bacterium]|jgi:hypothetical protein
MFRTSQNIYPDYLANFTRFDPIIFKGVIAVNIDDGDGRQKIGDGITHWSSLTYVGGTTIGNIPVQSGTPVNNQLVRYEDLYGTFRYTLQGKIDSETNWSTVDDVFPTFCLLIETDDISDDPTGRIKISDGVTQSNLIPWVWFNFDDFPTGYSLEYNGTDFDYVKYQLYNVLPFATTPLGKSLLDDGTWGYPTIIGPITDLTTTLHETTNLYVFSTITLGGFPTEPTSITLSTDGTDLFIDGQKVWTQYNDGTGSGLDADTLGGYYASSFPTLSYLNSVFPTVSPTTVSGNIVTFGSTDGLKLVDSGTKPSDFSAVGHLHTGTYSRYLGEFSTYPTEFATGDTYYNTAIPAIQMYINEIVTWITIGTP